MRRRGFIGTTGLATISFAGAHVPLGILSAGAQHDVIRQGKFAHLIAALFEHGDENILQAQGFVT